MIVVDFATLIAGHWALVSGGLGFIEIWCLFGRQEPVLTHPFIHPLVNYSQCYKKYVFASYG